MIHTSLGNDTQLYFTFAFDEFLTLSDTCQIRAINGQQMDILNL